MKPTGTPAFRLTKSCIWNSFRSSRKKHLLLTGGRGTGKTTLLRALFPEPLPGITTWAVPGDSVRLRDRLTDRELSIGVFDPALPGTENRMRPIPSALDTAAQWLRDCAGSHSDWVLIDEIGYLETGSSAYCREILELMERKQVAAAVRRQDLPFLNSLLERSDVFLVDLDDPFGPIGCVIMASGEGKRFGGNKLMADFRGKPMLQWVLEATDGIFQSRVVVTRHEDVRVLCGDRNIPAILHALPHRSDTVRLGMEAMEEDLTGCLFCPGDQPLLTWDTVAGLALCAKNHSGAIWRAAREGAPGSPVYFPRKYFEALRSLPEGKGGNVIAANDPDNVRCYEVPDPLELMDIDTREICDRLARQQPPQEPEKYGKISKKYENPN